MIDKKHPNYIYCRKMLPKVSRTFALVISVLKGEKYQAILLAYLLCRIADTIEDNTFLAPQEKEKLLQKFSLLLSPDNYSEADLELIEKPFRDLTSKIDDDELTAQTGRVLSVYYHLSVETRNCVTPWIQEMIKGMKKYQSFSVPSEHITAVQTVEELEDYCYYVAGTVGIMLTHLFIRFAKDISPKNQQKMHQLAVSFGIGLQLTNILKDFNTDLKRGWCYLPMSVLQKHGLTPETFRDQTNSPAAKEVVKEIRQLAKYHLKNALEYTFAIPRLERQIRLFCLWPLHMANMTLSQVTENSELFVGGTVKITRDQVKQTIIRTSIDWFSNSRQQKYFNQFSF